MIFLQFFALFLTRNPNKQMFKYKISLLNNFKFWYFLSAHQNTHFVFGTRNERNRKQYEEYTNGNEPPERAANENFRFEKIQDGGEYF